MKQRKSHAAALALLFIGMLSNLSALNAQISASETEYIPNELLVMLYDGTSGDKFFASLRDELSFNVIGVPSPSTGIYHLSVAPAEWPQAMLLLRGKRHVRAVQLNHIVSRRETVPNDPNYGQQWHHDEGGDHDIDSDLAWDVTTGGTAANGARIVVAVLEGGGSNYNHTDLIDNHWTNQAEIPGNGVDDDNNGYIDDFNGWNSGNNSDNIAGGGHGTSVSGMIGATGNNGVGGAGVNWDVDIMQIDMGNGLSESNVIAAYEYPKVMRDIYNESAGVEGAFVVATNASWGIDQANPANYPIWCAYYDDLGESGILNCGATTNSALNVDAVGDMPTACSSDYMVSVTATNDNDVRTFSGYGLTTIDLGAPGDQVYLPSGGSGYGNASGTSFASPCVAGAIGLVYSVPCPDLAELSHSNPQAAADMVLGYIYQGVDLVPNLLTEVVTGGRLNVANSVNLAVQACGPIACDLIGFSAETSCEYNAETDSVEALVALDVEFSNFLCQAQTLCFRDTLDTDWTCGLVEDFGIQIQNGTTAMFAGLESSVTYQMYFVTDTLVSDTLLFAMPDCSSEVPGCTDLSALNFDELATIDNGSCEYPCEDLVFTVTADCWPEEIGWSIVDAAGNEVAGVTPGTFEEDGVEVIWEGCVPHGCHVLTLTDTYGDGVFGSQWPGCELDGNYVLETAAGDEIIAMGDPDFGDGIDHAFCVPVIPGCTLMTACNYDAEANANDGSCFSLGDECDDENIETVLDAIGEDCLCAGVAAVEGCTDQAACNFSAESNVDDESCFYVAEGAISGPMNPTAGTTSTYSYNGAAANYYQWMATNGTIVGESAGVGLLEIQVEWDLSAGGQNSSVQVEEVEPSIECTGSVTLDLDLLVNGISELQAAGLQLYPNPASDNLRIDGLISWSEQGVVQCINVLGQTVIERRFQSLEYFVLPVTELPAGVFTVRLIDASEQGLESIQTSVIIQR
jgi:hypothetical protein